MTNCIRPEVAPHTGASLRAARSNASRMIDVPDNSWGAALNALTVPIPAIARSTRVAAFAAIERALLSQTPIIITGIHRVAVSDAKILHSIHTPSPSGVSNYNEGGRDAQE
jgi:hypothetical protein